MSRRSLLILALAAVVPGAGCESDPAGPPLGAAADAPAAVSWNEVLLEIVAAHPWTPPHAARAYAYLGVAQREALLELAQGPGASSRVAARAAVATASAAILRELYPVEEARIARALRALRPRAGAFPMRAQIDLGDAAGARAAQRLVERARADGYDAAWEGELPGGEGVWFSSPGEPPVAPLAGRMLPWSMASVEAFDPGPPPAYGSPAFLEDLAQVRAFSDQRSAEMTSIARFYEYGPGTPSPAGQYVALAGELILRHGLDELGAARTYALLGMAMADAGIACWHAKYEYMVMRPSQIDDAITLVVALPNFPAYPSGHSSFSGAAEVVLSNLFPSEAAMIRAFAEENGLSRVYGGVHFEFDNQAGLELGRRIAPAVLSADGRPAPPALAAR
ncbi:MAG TPA: vanadium-dependent haloperoxidase [Gemmatimonadota bacterium]|nr:vanadium-dependent haloperoxidase [Gemmatimonadota bacterium]